MQAKYRPRSTKSERRDVYGLALWILGGAGVRKSVTDTRHREYVIGPRRLRFDLAAQVADMHVDDPGLDRILVTPDRVEDLLPAQHLPGIAGQERQQVELGVSQLDLLTTPVDAALVDVDDEVAELEPVARGFGRL